MEQRALILAAHPAASQRRASADRRRRGLARLSRLAIAAIALILGVLSLTRMQVYAVHANERDAVGLMRQLGARLPGAEGQPRDLRMLAEGLLHPVEGASFEQKGRRLRRHGYLFQITAGPEEMTLFAWPSEHGLTGRAAYRFRQDQGLRGNPNEDGRHSGSELPPSLIAEDAWFELP
jgi:hypothetical protein